VALGALSITADIASNIVNKSHQVPALLRAQGILQLLLGRQDPVTAADMIALTGLPRSTLYLLLDALEQQRWIEKKDAGYIVGLGLYELGSAYLHHDGLQDAFRVAAATFVERYNEVLQLAVLDGVEVVYLAREDAHSTVRLMSDLGSRLPAHACALGKALLSQIDDSRLIALLPEKLAAVTSRTLRDRNLLLRELATVRKQGFARDNQEIADGLICFAVYIGETPLGKRVAVSTSIPSGRLGDDRHTRIIDGIKQVAREIGLRVGARVHR
jgi:DNA-binding IclR family transcriptional regulator